MPQKRLLNTPLDQPLTTEILVNGRIVPAAPGELLIEAMNRAAALANDTLREAGKTFRTGRCRQGSGARRSSSQS